ncbi:MAG: NAD(P)H-quinone oxidoreductase, partial [Pseudomonadota bacterium]
YPPPPGAPDTPGLEIAGDIVAVGASCGRFQVGDQVCALVAGGGYAEYCVAPEAQTLPVPAGMSVVHAAALPETFFTVWSNVFERGALAPGETLLVHGGTSGIGTTAIQLAKLFDAHVITTAGSDKKCARTQALGADLSINYKTTDFVEAARSYLGDGGVDVVLDMVGGDYVARNLSLLKPGGRHVSIAFLSGPKVELNMMPVMLKRLVLTGSTLRARDVGFKAAIASALEEMVWPALADGRIAPVIDSHFRLEDARKAHERMESSEHIGKIILTMSED